MFGFFKRPKKEISTLYLKVAIVTGAARGIGRCTALLFAEEGCDLMVTDYDDSEGLLSSLQEAVRQLGRRCISVVGDITELATVQLTIDRAVNELGRLDILVNNAGITQPKTIQETTEEDWDRMLNILKAGFLCSKAAVDIMIKQGSGNIVNLSSIVGRSGGFGGSGSAVHYAAAKAGIVGFTKALARQVAPNGVRVNAVAPGLINTRMIQWRSPELMESMVQKIPIGRVGEPEEIAQAILFLVSDASYVTGATLDVNGGLFMG